MHSSRRRRHDGACARAREGSARAPAPAPAKAPAPAPAPAKADKAPTLPLPPPELAAAVKRRRQVDVQGRRVGRQGREGPVTATNVINGALDGWWMQESMEAKGRMTFKMVAYTTYDATAKKWRRLAVMNGGHMIGTSEGMKDNKMVWNMDMMSAMGAGMMRDYMDMTDPKGMKAWGEMSMDKGKTWMKVYEMTCKK